MTSEDQRLAALGRQYDAAPAAGVNRYWTSIVTWCEDWPEDVPFFFWQTGTGSDMRLKPSVAGTPEAEGLPATANGFSDFVDFPPAYRDLEEEAAYELLDRMYVSSGMVCMLVDAADEHAAWALVRERFPDMVERFIEPAPEYTLDTLAAGGRFGRPYTGGAVAA